jgi:peptidyl-prolyl cis-trans isomerase C
MQRMLRCCIALTIAAVGCARHGEGPRATLVASVDPKDTVVATVEGRAIYASQVATQARAANQSVKEALDAVITAEVLASEAARRGLDADREVIDAGKQAAVYRLLALEFEPSVRAADIPERDVRHAYDRNRSVLDHDEYVHVWHILVQVKDTDSDEKKAKAKTLADEIYARAKQATDVEAFKAIAKAVELPPGFDKILVEELVTPRDGVTVPEFSHGAHDQLKKPGDITTPIKTKFGWHVIYLVKRIPPEHTSLAEVEPKLREGLLTEFQRRSFPTFIEEAMRRHTIELHADRLKEVE